MKCYIVTDVTPLMLRISDVGAVREPSLPTFILHKGGTS